MSVRVNARSRLRAVELSARIVRLQLAETFVISREARDWEDVVQVELAHDGLVGRGEAAPIDRYEEGPESALAFVERHAGDLGDDPFALETIGARLEEEPGERAAKAALDMALHDLCGKVARQPVWRLLGMPRVGPPTSWTVWLGDPDDMARRAERAATRFRRLKLKLGGGDGLDVDRVRAVRGVTELPLQVDVNEWWSLDEALEALPQLAALGVRVLRAAAQGRRRGRRAAARALADPDLPRRGLPHRRRRAPLRRARPRRQRQARQVRRDPGGVPRSRTPRARSGSG